MVPACFHYWHWQQALPTRLSSVLRLKANTSNSSFHIVYSLPAAASLSGSYSPAAEVSKKRVAFCSRTSPLFQSSSSPDTRQTRSSSSFPWTMSSPTAATSTPTAKVDVPEIKGHVAPNGVAVITIDRPKALNAMNLDMDRAFQNLLDSWSASPAVKAVLVEGSMPRAYCAGMDIKSTAATIREDKQTQYVPQVFSAEYRLICTIARYPKPYISLMDGVTMGFGIGLSGHGSVRVVTEKTTLAMPENAIGLFPDVGFAHIGARMPGSGALGTYLAVTGARITTPEDALFSGLATHSVPSGDVQKLREALLAADFSSSADPSLLISQVLASFPPASSSSSSSSSPRLQQLLPAIQAAFHRSASPTATLLYDQLNKQAASEDEQVSSWARDSLQALSSSSPFSLAICLRHFHAVSTAVAAAAEAAQQGLAPHVAPDGLNLATIEGVMTSEYRIALRSSTRPDFLEGVRAVLVDKDKNPKWVPSTVETVDATELDCVFAPLLEGEELVV